eukprot:8562475-Alexandrium_andersonii.AAC.1
MDDSCAPPPFPEELARLEESPCGNVVCSRVQVAPDCLPDHRDAPPRRLDQWRCQRPGHGLSPEATMS